MSRWYLLFVPMPLLLWSFLCWTEANEATTAARRLEDQRKYAESASKDTESRTLMMVIGVALMALITIGLLMDLVVRCEIRIRKLEKALTERQGESGEESSG